MIKLDLMRNVLVVVVMAGLLFLSAWVILPFMHHLMASLKRVVYGPVVLSQLVRSWGALLIQRKYMLIVLLT